MTDNTKLSKLRLALLTAAVATGLTTVTTSVSAEDGDVSEKDMLSQAVALYEKLSGDEVAVPDTLINDCGDANLGKAIMLGFTSSDDAAAISDAVAIRKQDALTILYKTIISYDYSYALTTTEIDRIMNTCYDNALVDEENRAAYAFMMKHDIVTDTYATEPNKIITWSSCRTLVDILYDLFVQDVTFTVSDKNIKIGATAETVINSFGEPSRIDKSDYDFSWYVYNSDPSQFMMIGIKEDRICSFFTNSPSFTFGDLKAGDDYLLAYKYIENDSFRIIKNSDGFIDAIMYNPYTKSDVAFSNSTYLRACELIDLINSQREKSGYAPLNIDNELYSAANDMVTQAKYQELARDPRFAHTMDDAQHEEGYDVFALYEKLINSDCEALDEATQAIGVSTYVDTDLTIYTSIVCSEASAALTTEPVDIEAIEPKSYVFEEETQIAMAENTTEASEYVFETDAEEITFSTEAPAAPSVAAPSNESTVAAGEDVTIKLNESVANEYYVSIYSLEDDEFLVNSYIKTPDKELVFKSDLFTVGKDYAVSVSAVNEMGSSAPCEFTFCYGEVPEDAITFTTDEKVISTDNDYLDISWNCALYSNFVLDIYNIDGQLMLSEVISDIDNITVNNVDAGTYYVYLTALRNGTNGAYKAQASATVKVTIPDPVITEHILNEGEKFYPIYEDKEMGLLYIYDEEIIDVEELSYNGRIVNTKKKKITEKQVKDIGYYRNIAMQQERVEYFVGSATPTLNTDKLNPYTYQGSTMSIYDKAMGDAVIEEAKKYLDVPYVWGGTTPSGFDCSGLVQYVYRSFGIELNRVSQDQVKQGLPLTREQLMPGDLVFFADSTGDVHHVGIYAGNGQMIHAPYTGASVCYQSIDTPYYKSQFCGGRRVY